jgi:hypothetical protein
MTNLYKFAYNFTQIDGVNPRKQETYFYINIVAAHNYEDAVAKFIKQFPHVILETVKIEKLCQVNEGELSVVKQVLNAMSNNDAKAEALIF